MEKILIQILLLFIFWLIVNTILKTLLGKYQDDNTPYEIKNILVEASKTVLNYRKAIMFDLITLLVLFIFNVKVLYWIAIIYNIIIAIIEALLIVVSFTTELNHEGNEIIKNELWLVFWSKLFNEISSIILIYTFSVLI